MVAGRVLDGVDDANLYRPRDRARRGARHQRRVDDARSRLRRRSLNLVKHTAPVAAAERGHRRARQGDPSRSARGGIDAHGVRAAIDVAGIGDRRRRRRSGSSRPARRWCRRRCLRSPRRRCTARRRTATDRPSPPCRPPRRSRSCRPSRRHPRRGHRHQRHPAPRRRRPFGRPVPPCPLPRRPGQHPPEPCSHQKHKQQGGQAERRWTHGLSLREVTLDRVQS